MSTNEQLCEALKELCRVIDSAGIDNLARGVQLGNVSWFHKATAARELAESALTQPPAPEQASGELFAAADDVCATLEHPRNRVTALQMWRLRDALKAATPAAPVAAKPAFNGWYCAHCQRGVDGSEVTYHEQHTVCGRVITDDEPPVAAKPETQWERELLAAKMIAAADWQEHGIHPNEPLFGSTDMRRIAALLADGKAGGEVAGYVLVNKESREGVMFYSEDMKPDMATIKDKFELVTVYTRPQPAAQVAQPLTEKEIEAGRGEVFSINNPFCPCDSKTFRKAVQWAERRHGIGKDHG